MKVKYIGANTRFFNKGHVYNVKYNNRGDMIARDEKNRLPYHVVKYFDGDMVFLMRTS